MPVSAFHLRSSRLLAAPTLSLLFLVYGCATDVNRKHDELIGSSAIERHCGPVQNVPRVIVHRHISSFQRDSPTEMLRGDGLSGRFSQQAQIVSEIIGAKDLLRELVSLEAQAAEQSEGPTVQLLHVQQQLSNRIVLAILEVARTAAEADCEEERADQLADRLQDVRDKRVRRQTLIAIVGDAMIGIVAGGLSLALQETASAATAILGGSVATGFGLAAFFDNSRHEFQHQRNLLAEVWQGQVDSVLFPSSVWRYLNRPLLDDPEQRSLRDALVLRWRQDGRLGEAGSDTERRRTDLFFGLGGAYEIDDLRARAAMLDLVEADVNLMSQDLERLMYEALVQEVP